MAPRILVTATLLTSLALCGCSSRKLSDVFARRDYVPLDEADSIQETNEGASVFASRSRTLDPDEEAREDEYPKKKSGFSLSRLLKLGDKGPAADPFADEDYEQRRETTADAAPMQVGGIVDAKRIEELQRRTDALEQRQQMTAGNGPFDAEKSRFPEVPEFNADQASIQPEASGAGRGESFADFMARRTASGESAVKNAVADAREQLAESDSGLSDDSIFANLQQDASAQETATQAFADSAASAAEPLMNDFDSLLAEADSAAGQEFSNTMNEAPTAAANDQDRFDAELFPALEEALADINPAARTMPTEEFAGAQPAPAASVGFDEFAGLGAIEETAADVSAFAEPAAAVASSDRNDPWSAFERDSMKKTAAAETTWAHQETRSDFAWTSNQTGHQDAAEFFKNAGAESPPTQPAGSPFMQVSSTETAGSENTALVIPTTTMEIPFPETENVDVFANVDESVLPEAEDAVVEAAEPEPTVSVAGWSGRTWVFLLGCVVVLLLLFLPERQNRARS